MSTIKVFIFNPVQENTYVISDETNECVIIDPGCYFPEEKKEIFEYIQQNNLTPVHLLNTHCHTDHVLGNAFIHDSFNLAPKIHEKEIEVLNHAKNFGSSFGLFMDESPEPDVCLTEGGEIKFGNTTLKILFTPGHSPGSVCFLNDAEHYVIGGDLIFRNSIGRTDLPGGDFETLIKSIREKLFILEDRTVVHSGHGPSTTIGHEKENNPFLNNY